MDCRKKILFAAGLVLALAALTACQKEYEIIDELGLSQHSLKVKAEPGFTHIAVYSTGSWSVALDRETDWASLDRLSGEGLGEFVFSWSANFGVARSVNIVVRRDGREETINVIQAGSIAAPYINIADSRVVLPRQHQDYEIQMSTNLGFCLDDFRARAIYYRDAVSVPDTLEVGSAADNAWITGYEVLPDKVRLTVSENADGVDRNADIVYYMRDAAGSETRGSVSLTQSSEGPVFSLSADHVDYYANAEEYFVPSATNNIWSLPGVELTSDVPWIGEMSLGEGGITFVTQQNQTGSPRSGQITLSCTFQGETLSTSLRVTQAAEKLMGFEELRSKGSGALSTTDVLEGIIVSDPASPNLCSSPQTGQFSFDRSENARTAYLESLDGNYGVCLKFASQDENVLEEGDHVRIALDGTTLLRETVPLRVTLQGLHAAQFTVLEKDVEIPLKERTIAQLSDTDIFTRVSLARIEILCKDGAYTNASEGYSLQDELNPLGTLEPRWDVAPLLCTDPNGNSIFMLTNAAAPWRRTGGDVQWYSCLPQGAGTLTGIIVSDAVAPVRWGNLGRYQIRPMREEDIDLSNEADKFSNTICEWNWNGEGDKTLSPDEGKGSLKVYEAARKFTADYNNPYLPAEDAPNGNGTTNQKGLVQEGALQLNHKWWDFESTLDGRYFDVEFITTGISGTNLVIGIVWGHGTGNSTTIFAPSHWDVLYSTDGQNFTYLETIKQRSCAWWSSPQTSQDAVPGFTEHLVRLPGSCFGKSKVVVRFKAADLVTDIAPATSASTWAQALGIEQGTMSASANADQAAVRIGTITVRYN